MPEHSESDSLAGKFGEWLSFAMEMRGHVKAAGLAAEIGVTESAISHWKNGNPITLRHAIELRNALSVSLDWLLCGDGTFDIHDAQNRQRSAPYLSPDAAREAANFLSHFTR